MGDCRAKTIMDYIRDLTDKSIKHDYDKELANIEQMMQAERCKMQEEYSIAYRKLENENRRLKTIMVVAADYIESHI